MRPGHLCAVTAAAPAASGSNTAHLFVFTNDKAGMQGLPKERINQIIYEASKNSAFFARAQAQDAKTDAQIAAMKKTLAQATAADMSRAARRVEALRVEIEATRDLSRMWCVVDMDAFYASVEERDDPSLVGKPMAVGGMDMISTANYVARRFGVRAAMPGFVARKLCPQLVFVHPHFDKYQEAADVTRAIFKDYDPHFSAGSLDEAYLDITDACKARVAAGDSAGGDIVAVASSLVAEMRQRVFEATKLTASAGIAANPLLAKIASDCRWSTEHACYACHALLHNTSPP